MAALERDQVDFTYIAEAFQAFAEAVNKPLAGVGFAWLCWLLHNVERVDVAQVGGFERVVGTSAGNTEGRDLMIPLRPAIRLAFYQPQYPGSPGFLQPP